MTYQYTWLITVLTINICDKGYRITGYMRRKWRTYICVHKNFRKARLKTFQKTDLLLARSQANGLR